MMEMVMSRTQWMIHLLTMMIQSCLGVALSVACLWSYRERMILFIGESKAEFFYYFSFASLFISVAMLIRSFVLFSVQCAELSLTGDPDRMRLTVGNDRRRAYGAFGYYSIV